MSKYDPKPYHKGRVKDKKAEELNVYQLKHRNEKARLNYLRQRIELGFAPQIRKNVTPAIRKLYEDNGLSLAIYFPQDNMPMEDIKADHKKIRARIRNMLPSGMDIKDTNIIVDHVLTGVLPESALIYFDMEGIREYCSDYLLGKDIDREHRIQMIANRTYGRVGGLASAAVRRRKFPFNST